MNTLYLITALAITALFPCAIYWLVRREDAAYFKWIKRLRERNLGAEPKVPFRVRTVIKIHGCTYDIW